MRRIVTAVGGTLVGVMLLAGSVAAAGPTPGPSNAGPKAVGGTVAAVLGLTQAEVRELRHDGLSLAQIAERQKVAVQGIVDALVAQWTERIEVRVANGALTQAQATELKAQLQTRATTMVSSTAPGGMRGAAVGAGPANGQGAGNGVRARDGSGTGANGRGTGNGSGDCDGTGPHGPARP